MPRLIWLLRIAALLVGLGLSAATAQLLPSGTGGDPPPEGADAAIEALRKNGYTVIVAPPVEREDDAAGATAPTLSQVGNSVAAARMELQRIIAESPEAPSRMIGAMRGAGDGSLGWLLPALLLSIVAAVAGILAHYVAALFMSRLTATLGQASLDTRSGRIFWAIATLLRLLAGAVAFAAVGALTTLIIVPTRSPVQVTALHVVGAVAGVLILRAILRALLAPRTSAARLLPFADGLARALYRRVLMISALGVGVTWVCFWLAYFPLSPRTHQLLLIVAPTVAVVSFAALIAVHRRDIKAAILGHGDETGPARRLIGVAWPVLVMIYLGASWVANVIEVTSSNRLTMGPIVPPFVALGFGLIVAGLLTLVQEHRAKTHPVGPAWRALYERFVRWTAALAGIALLCAMWRVFDGPWGPLVVALFGIAIVVHIAALSWGAVCIYFQERLDEERAAQGPALDSEGEGFGPGATRTETLLPIFRNIMLFLIASIVVMVALYAMGVSVAPLFAGAGVVGLAIGFGAQALIRDVFSGAFFLLDDAFRRGEYVEVGGTAGMVEKISVRSFQLRHHKGPLHTIPFGEIRQLTNYSRDWVIMKLPIRLTYDTDVEKVRKLVKKLGQEMAANPEYGHLFLEPPKSQGVIQMEDSAMIVRIKFKTKPGDQFILRRHVYQRVHDLFAENGIKFAHREVTVRVAGGGDEETRRRAALGAVTTDDAAADKLANAADAM